MQNPTLFDKRREPVNIIPHGGEAIYHGEVFDEMFADHVYNKLLRETPWKQDEPIMHGKAILVARKVAWFSSKHEWPEELLDMKKRVEELTGVTYRYVLLNLYDTGGVGMGWHNDEESLGYESSIASVSLGAERRFDFRHMKTKETISIVLEHGSLLVMQGALQNFWKHQVPKTKKVLHPRVNLTFRE